MGPPRKESLIFTSEIEEGLAQEPPCRAGTDAVSQRQWVSGGSGSRAGVGAVCGRPLCPRWWAVCRISVPSPPRGIICRKRRRTGALPPHEGLRECRASLERVQTHTRVRLSAACM